MDLTQCKAGKHSLKTIYTGCADAVSEEVVRWCENCGSVVVDVDYDDRTDSGRIMKMIAPKITKSVGK